MWCERSSEGTGRPTSAHAACSEATMIAVESISVPSQSNTTRSKRLPTQASVQFVHKLLQVGWQRRFNHELGAARRVLEADARGVQKHALETIARELFVELEIAILIVAGNGKAEMREVHADLVRAAGLQLSPQKAEIAPRLL